MDANLTAAQQHFSLAREARACVASAERIQAACLARLPLPAP